MKRPFRLEALILLAGVISACGLLETNAVKDITTDVVPAARVKFHNYSPNSVQVNFFSDNVKMSAISSTSCTPLPVVDTLKAKCLAAGIEATTGVAYAANASGGLYLSIAPGTHALAAKMAAKDTVIATVSQTVDNGKYYSFFLSGIYNTTAKTAEAFVVEDPIPAGAIDYNRAYVRLVNAVSDGTGPLTLYTTSTVAGSTATAQNTAVAYKTAGTFVVIDEGIYDLGVRYAGAGTNLISLAGQSLVGGRVYTVTARGSTATASTLGLSFLQNTR